MKVILTDRNVQPEAWYRLLTKDYVVSPGRDIRRDCDIDALTISVETYRERNFDCVTGRTQGDVNGSTVWSDPTAKKEGSVSTTMEWTEDDKMPTK